MYKLLVTDKMLDAVIDHIRGLSEVELDFQPEITPAELLKVAGSYDALIVKSRTKVTKDVIEAGKKLKAIGRAGVGLDNIDIESAKSNGVEVLNTPTATSNTVAEHTIGLIIGLSRHIAAADASLKQGKWEKKKFMGHEIQGKTLGIIGYGRIGSRVAKKAKALGMEVLVFDKRQKGAEVDSFPVFTSLSKFLPQLDYLSLHVPYNDYTKNMISAKELSKLKSNCYLINCSRGGVVNEIELNKALKAGKITGAAIDVFTREPAFNQKLVRLPNVLATPHIASATYEAQLRSGVEIADKVLAQLKTHGSETGEKNMPELKIVHLRDIRLHENLDKNRVAPLVKKIKEVKIFTNPPLVTRLKNGAKEKYLILDGSNRIESLKDLGLADALVQLIDYDDPKLHLKNWNHLVEVPDMVKFLEKLTRLPGLTDRVTSIEEANNHVKLGEWLVFVVFDDESIYGFKKPKSIKKQLELLNKIVAIYQGFTKIERFESSELDKWSEDFKPGQTLVVFPEFSKDQVLEAAEQKAYFPSGITRYLIPQRVLGVDLPLKFLKEKLSLDKKNEKLRQYIASRLKKGSGLRYYEESIFVFD